MLRRTGADPGPLCLYEGHGRRHSPGSHPGPDPADGRARRVRAGENGGEIVAENNTPGVVGILSGLGILLISVVMLKGALPRSLALLGIATGGLGFAADVLRHAVPEVYAVTDC